MPDLHSEIPEFCRLRSGFQAFTTHSCKAAMLLTSCELCGETMGHISRLLMRINFKVAIVSFLLHLIHCSALMNRALNPFVVLQSDPLEEYCDDNPEADECR